MAAAMEAFPGLQDFVDMDERDLNPEDVMMDVNRVQAAHGCGGPVLRLF
jgi:hypothetical protein